MAFQLDTTGAVHETQDNPPRFYPAPCMWPDLAALTQGYIEALFRTSNGLSGRPLWQNKAFRDLAPATLARIMADCDAFQIAHGEDIADAAAHVEFDANATLHPDNASHRAGAEFWRGRGVENRTGFADWPEPFASRFRAGPKAFPPLTPYIGEDGLIYLRDA